MARPDEAVDGDEQLETGSWRQEVGDRKLETGSWRQRVGDRELETESWRQRVIVAEGCA
jgi:hypothetical protein